MMHAMKNTQQLFLLTTSSHHWSLAIGVFLFQGNKREWLEFSTLNIKRQK